MNKVVKKRSKNFKPEETAVLVEEVEKRRALLFGPLKGPKMTQFHRDRAWQQVVDAVNAVAPTVRTAAELRSKFKDLKTRTKQNANAVKREGRKTGGGHNPANNPPSAVESKLIQFIGTDSIEGISGGVDPFRRQVINLPSTSTATSEDVTVFEPIPKRPSLKKIPPPSIDPVITNNQDPNPPVRPPPPIAPTTPTTLPPIPKRGKKRTIAAVVEEVEKTTTLQQETNQLLGELVSEVRKMRAGFDKRLDDLLNLKKLELELLEQNIELKRRKLDLINNVN